MAASKPRLVLSFLFNLFILTPNIAVVSAACAVAYPVMAVVSWVREAVRLTVYYRPRDPFGIRLVKFLLIYIPTSFVGVIASTLDQWAGEVSEVLEDHIDDLRCLWRLMFARSSTQE